MSPEVGSALHPPEHQASFCFLSVFLFLSVLPASPLPCGPLLRSVLSPLPSPRRSSQVSSPDSMDWTFPSSDPAAFSSRIKSPRLPNPFHSDKDCRISVLELCCCLLLPLLPHSMEARGWAILPTRHLSNPSLRRCPSPRPLIQTKSTYRPQASCWVPAGFDYTECAGGADRPTRTTGICIVGEGWGAEAGLRP